MCIRDSVSLYAVGYDAASGYALLTPEDAGGGLSYERLADVALGGTQAKRWRYTDAGSRWDFLAAEAGGFFSVSYTHLDVYKRQQSNKWPRRCPAAPPPPATEAS